MTASVFDHPWLGALFGDDEVATLWGAEAQLGHMLRFEDTFTAALMGAGIVSQEAGVAARAALAKADLDIDALAAGTQRDGVVVPAFVRQLRAGLDVPEAIHTGATSQDVIDTALVLTLQQIAQLFDARLGRLIDALDQINARFGKVQITGRTRMQAAMPIAASTRITAWRAPLVAQRDQLHEIANRVCLLQLGGAAGDRSALGDKADTIGRDMAQNLGLGYAPASWHSTRGGIVELGSALSVLSGSLGKIGQDIALMAQQGVGDIGLSGGGGSSAMPHKSNPVLAELLVTLARFNAAQTGGLHGAMVHEQERSGAAWALEWMIVPQITQATGTALLTAEKLVWKIQRIGPK